MLFSKAMETVMDSMFGNTFGASEPFDYEKLYEFRDTKNISSIDIYLVNLISPVKTVYILLFTARNYLLVFIAIDYLNIFIIVYTLATSIRWLSMYFLYLAYLSDKEFDNIKIVSYLRSMKQSNE